MSPISSMRFIAFYLLIFTAPDTSSPPPELGRLLAGSCGPLRRTTRHAPSSGGVARQDPLRNVPETEWVPGPPFARAPWAEGPFFHFSPPPPIPFRPPRSRPAAVLR